MLVWKWLSFLGRARKKNNSTEPLTVKRYIELNPETTVFWLQVGQMICKYDIKRAPHRWEEHKNDRILRIEHLDGEPVVLHVEPVGERGR